MKIIICLLIGISFYSCSTHKKNRRISQTSYCSPPHPYVYDSSYIPLTTIIPIIQQDSLLVKKYSYQDLLIANATGTLFLLQDLIHLDETKTEENLTYILLKKQQIFNRLLLASVEVASLAAELDCESERSKQLGDYLDHLNDTRVEKYTILSVIAGAITGIATLGNKNSNAQIVVGVSGSIVSAVFGGLAAVSSKQKIVFKHPRNLLSDIWYESRTSPYYPPFIWFILKQKEFSGNQKYSIIHNIKERWVDEGMVDTLKKKAG